MRRRIISSKDAIATASIIVPNALRVSPIIGLLMSNSLPLISNSRKCIAAGSTHALAKELFYQREINGQRFGPLELTRSKSKPGYWLTVSQLGHMLGFAYKHAQQQVL
jgi:hypothetical protein